MSALFEALCGDLPEVPQGANPDDRFIKLEKLGIGANHALYPVIEGLANRGYLRTNGQPSYFDTAQILEFLTRVLFVRLPQEHPLAQAFILMDRVSPELAAAKNEASRLRRTQPSSR